MRFVSVFALVAFAAPAMAQQAPATDGKAAATEERPICRRVGAATGSIMGGKRVCHTKAEWAALSIQNREMRDVQRELGRNNRMPVDRSN